MGGAKKEQTPPCDGIWLKMWKDIEYLCRTKHLFRLFSSYYYICCGGCFCCRAIEQYSKGLQNMALKISLLVGTFKAFHSLSNEHCDPVFSDATNWPSGKLYWSWHHSSFRVRHFPNYDWHDLILAFPCCCYLNFLLWVYMLSFYSLSLQALALFRGIVCVLPIVEGQNCAL